MTSATKLVDPCNKWGRPYMGPTTLPRIVCCHRNASLVNFIGILPEDILRLFDFCYCYF